MSKESLVMKKDELRKRFEECFEGRLDEHLTPQGLAAFWSENTSFEDAVIMLDKAALLTVFGDIRGIIVEITQGAENHKDDCKCDACSSDSDYNVYDTVKKEMVLFGFSTYEEAYEEAKEYCLKNGVKISDVKVCKMYE